jgi:hypothetical protein
MDPKENLTPMANCLMCWTLGKQEDMVQGVAATCHCAGWVCKTGDCIEDCVTGNCRRCWVELEEDGLNSPPYSAAELSQMAANGEEPYYYPGCVTQKDVPGGLP